MIPFSTRSHIIRLMLCLTVLFGLNSCSFFKENPVVDYVEMVRYEYRAPTGTGCSPFAGVNYCAQAIFPVYHYSSGKLIVGGECCLHCTKWNNVCKISAGRVLEFDTSTLPLSPRVKIPPHKPVPGLVVWTRKGGVSTVLGRDLCEEKYSSEDVRGERLRSLEEYVRVLTTMYGANAGLDPDSNNPRDVCLRISHDDPPVQYPNGERRLVAGRISCAEGAAARSSVRNCRYQIDIWEKAFSEGNVCAGRIYKTIAHEFKHILQSVELNLPVSRCNQTENNAQQEKEAAEFADKVFPLCKDC